MSRSGPQISLYRAAESLQQIASDLLDQVEAVARATTQTERIRARRHLQSIREDSLIVTKAAERLLEKFSDL